MTPSSEGTPRGGEGEDRIETVRRMSRALDYLIGVSAATGLSRVAAKLAAAQAELLMTSGRAMLGRDAPILQDGARRAEEDPQRH